MHLQTKGKAVDTAMPFFILNMLPAIAIKEWYLCKGVNIRIKMSVFVMSNLPTAIQKRAAWLRPHLV